METMRKSGNNSLLIWCTCLALFLLHTACSNSTTSSVLPELEDGMFLAVIDDNRHLEGEALFEITTPSNEYFPDYTYDPVLFLSLKIGKIDLPDMGNGSDRLPHRDQIELWTGIFLSSGLDDQDENLRFNMDASIFRQLFVDPATLSMHDVSREKSTVEIMEFSDDLLAGEFTVTAINSLGNEVTINGEFRALAVSGDDN